MKHNVAKYPVQYLLLLIIATEYYPIQCNVRYDDVLHAPLLIVPEHAEGDDVPRVLVPRPVLIGHIETVTSIDLQVINQLGKHQDDQKQTSVSPLKKSRFVNSLLKVKLTPHPWISSITGTWMDPARPGEGSSHRVH